MKEDTFLLENGADEKYLKNLKTDVFFLCNIALFSCFLIVSFNFILQEYKSKNKRY
jgi:hypothetical protein